jgi:hypothetical protein
MAINRHDHAATLALETTQGCPTALLDSSRSVIGSNCIHALGIMPAHALCRMFDAADIDGLRR